MKRAIEMAYNVIDKKQPIYSYGQLIHNKTVTDDLQKKGLQIVEDLDNIETGTLLIRSHGVEKALYDKAEQKGLEILDGTCPFVKKIHDIVHQKQAEGKGILIVGDGTHPEVVGIAGGVKYDHIANKEATHKIQKFQQIKYMRLWCKLHTDSQNWTKFWKFCKKEVYK